MSTKNKINNKVEEVGGKAKQKIGKHTGNRKLQTEGKTDQAKGSLKQAGQKVKDAF